MARRINVAVPSKNNYDIVIEHDFKQLAEELSVFDIKNKKLCIMTDSHVSALYADSVIACLPIVKRSAYFPSLQEKLPKL